jgi:predicted MFS family arabinose efflux permease
MSSKLSQTFSALHHPNFRLWFSGQVVSIIGTWMQATAQGFLIYQLTQSTVFLGIVGFASGFPTWLFTLYGGMIADRISRRKLILITQTSMMVLAFILAFLAFTNLVQPWHIVVLAFCLGTANAFDAPARQSFVVELVDREDLTNAIALNSTIFNIGTVVGPAFAGLIYAWLGPAWCFTINGISFLAVIFALVLMRIKPQMKAIVKTTLVKNLLAGVQYAFGDKDIRVLLINLAVISVFGFSLMTLMPAWATDILGGDVKTNGLLLSARGVGSLIGALMIAYLGSRNMRGKIWSVGNLVMPLALLGFSLVRLIPVSLAMLVVLGWSLMSVVNVSNALVQSHVPDELRGRVMGVYILVFQGGMPIGSLFAGAVASALGAPTAVMINAFIILVVTGTLFFIRPKMRQLN